MGTKRLDFVFVDFHFDDGARGGGVRCDDNIAFADEREGGFHLLVGLYVYELGCTDVRVSRSLDCHGFRWRTVAFNSIWISKAVRILERPGFCEADIKLQLEFMQAQTILNWPNDAYCSIRSRRGLVYLRHSS